MLNFISLCDCYGTKRNVNFRLPKNLFVTTNLILTEIAVIAQNEC